MFPTSCCAGATISGDWGYYHDRHADYETKKLSLQGKKESETKSKNGRERRDGATTPGFPKVLWPDSKPFLRPSSIPILLTHL